MIHLLTTVIDEKTKPQDLERIRRNLVDVARELQGQRTVRIIADVELADGVPTPVAHRLGRRAFVFPSPVRGASTSGRIEEIRDGSHDPNQYVVLEANGFGATVTIDLEVV